MFYIASTRGNTAIVKALLEASALTDIQNNNKDTALILGLVRIKFYNQIIKKKLFL